MYVKKAMISIHLPPDIEARLEHLAKITHRSKSYYIQCAIDEFLDDQEDCLIATARLEEPYESPISFEDAEKILGIDDA